MLAPSLTYSRTQFRRVTSIFLRASRIGGLTFLLALIGACSAFPPAPVAGADPADPTARAPQTTYRSVLDPYVSARPVEAKSWQEQNERPALGEKP
jgi:hypothetical protein